MILLNTLIRTLVLVFLCMHLSFAGTRSSIDINQLVGHIKNGQSAQLKLALDGRTFEGIGQSGRAILMATAIESAQSEAIDALVERGMDINRPLSLSQQGGTVDITPLLHAISAKAGPTIVSRLIAKGANVNKTSEGLVPLNFALSLQQYDIAAILLDNAASATAVDELTGMTTLMELSVSAKGASDKALQDLAKRLVSAGCKVNAQNKRGGTALFFAVFSGNPTMVRILLELNANPNIKNDKGETPLAVAIRRQREDLAALLKQFGAQS